MFTVSAPAPAFTVVTSIIPAFDLVLDTIMVSLPMPAEILMRLLKVPFAEPNVLSKDPPVAV